MADIRLKPKKFVGANGKTYMLVCTFNTLADLEEEYGDVYRALTSKSIFKTVRVALASMINDYNEINNIAERFTPTEAGRLISTNANESRATCELVIKLIQESVTSGTDDNEETEKN